MKDPPRKDTHFPIVPIIFDVVREDNFSTKDKIAGPKCVLYSAVDQESVCNLLDSYTCAY